MPTTARTPRQTHDKEQTPAWIALASMFVDQRLDKRGAVGAYVAAAAILTVSVIILLANHH
jgi:hypothetical protein